MSQGFTNNRTTQPNAELRRRIQRLEDAQDRELTGDRFELASSQFRSGGTPPRVSGLTLVRAKLGQAAITWNKVAIRDLRAYEVQLSSNTGFTNATIEKVTNEEFAFQDPPEGDFFVRVRAINQVGTAGPFSGTISGASGLVVTDDIEDLAVTTPKFVDFSVTDFASVSASTVSLPAATTVEVQVSLLSTGASLNVNASYTVTSLGGGGSVTCSLIRTNLSGESTIFVFPATAAVPTERTVNTLDATAVTVPGNVEEVFYTLRFAGIAAGTGVLEDVFLSVVGPKK